MKIGKKEFINKLNECSEDKKELTSLILEHAPDLTADELKKHCLPNIDVVAKIEAKKLAMGYDFAPLQPTKIVNPETLKNIKPISPMSRRDALVLTQGEWIKKEFGSAKDFQKEMEKTIFERTMEKSQNNTTPKPDRGR